MRVAFVTTSGPGHINHIHDNIPIECTDYKTFVVRFKDDPLPRSSIMCDIFTLNSTKCSNIAIQFNKQRANKLVDVLHCSIYEYDPDLIIYDFFALEAHSISLKLGVPAICYIPATLRPDEGPGSTCSDGYLPIERMYWVLRPRQDTILPHTQFVKPKFHINTVLDVLPNNDNTLLPLIVVTFGTVVPRYKEHDAKIRAILKDISRIEGFRIVYIGLKDYVDSIETNDLVSYLNIADYVIFHGGGNTYAELLTLNNGIRAVVCPFFGDQFETARQIDSLYSGDIIRDLKRAPRIQCNTDTFNLVPSIGIFSDYFKYGDLVFGHKHHRKSLQLKFPNIDLHLEHFKPFQEFATGLPAIADVYNDEYLNTKTRPPGDFSDRFEDFKTIVGQDPVKHEYELVYRCIELLELTITKWKGTIHFVCGEGIGPATRIELDYIEKHWDRLKSNIIFYNLDGVRTKAPFDRPRKIRKHCTTNTLQRIKSPESILEKSNVENYLFLM